MKEKLQAILDFISDRMAESSTWQGLGFLITMTGAKFGAGIDWAQGAALGATLSATIKALLPDRKKPTE